MISPPNRPLARRLFATTIRVLGWIRFPKIASKKKLIIFKLDHIGDFVVAIGAIREIVRWARATEHNSITIITSTVAAPLARREFRDCQVVSIPYAFDFFRGGFFACLAAAMRSFIPLAGGTLVCLRHQRTLIQDLLLHWLNARISYATLSKNNHREDLPAPRFAPTNPSRPPESTPANTPLELVFHAAVVESLVGNQFNEAAISPSLRSFSISNSNVIVVFPCAHGTIRDYPAQAVAEALNQLQSAAPSHCFQLVGRSSERPRLDQIRRFFASKTGGDLEIVLPTSIEEASHLIANSALVIAMESGPAHIATALNKKGVFVIGGGHYGLVAPWTRSWKQRWITSPLPCFGCNWHCHFTKPRCITEIPPEHIAEISMILLKDPHFD